jgi:heat shock protein HslJ
MKNPPVLAPGQPFTKGWRIRNNGTCPWTDTYSLSYVQGNVPQAQMGGQRTFIQGVVPPGGTYDMYVDMVAPVVPGTYQGIWQMLSSISYPFGQRIWVGIQVPAPPTPTPQITPTPSTTISFSANPTYITAGQPVNFNWSVQNAQAVYFYAQGQPWQNNMVNAVGGTVVYPATTTTYELRVVALNGAVDVQQITIQVSQPLPVINYFTAEPTQIKAGACVNLTWQTSGGATHVQLMRNQYVILDNAQLTGGAQDCPDTTGQVVYTLSAKNAVGNSVTNQQIVNVEAPPPANPLVGTHWQMLSYYDGVGAMLAILPGTDVDITFGAASDIGGSAGCNTYSGSYIVSGASMAMTGISATKKVCDSPAGIMQQESTFLGLLSQTQTYSLNGSQLKFFNSNGQLLLEFAPET